MGFVNVKRQASKGQGSRKLREEILESGIEPLEGLIVSRV